jgi:hypothetical protein
METELIQTVIDHLKEHIVLLLNENHPQVIIVMVQTEVMVHLTEAAAVRTEAVAAVGIHADKGKI